MGATKEGTGPDQKIPDRTGPDGRTSAPDLRFLAPRLTIIDRTEDTAV